MGLKEKRSKNLIESFKHAFDGLNFALKTVSVISLELINTAIEEAVNLSTLEINIRAKHAKDVAAGAVLFSAIIAFIVGIVIFLPKVIAFIGGLL